MKIKGSVYAHLNFRGKTALYTGEYRLPYPGITCISRDTGIHIYIQDLPAAIADRGVRCGVVKSISAEAAR